jgi:hypothetical protein
MFSSGTVLIFHVHLHCDLLRNENEMEGTKSTNIFKLGNIKIKINTLELGINVDKN